MIKTGNKFTETYFLIVAILFYGIAFAQGQYSLKPDFSYNESGSIETYFFPPEKGRWNGYEVRNGGRFIFPSTPNSNPAAGKGKKNKSDPVFLRYQQTPQYNFPRAPDNYWRQQQFIVPPAPIVPSVIRPYR